MTGGWAGPPPRTERSARAAGVAAVVLLVLAVLLYGPWPIPVDRLLPLAVPRHFWFLLAIILSVGAIGCLSIWEQGMPRSARLPSPRSSRAAPSGRAETLGDALAGPTPEEPFPTIPLSVAGPAPSLVPAATAPPDPEISKILEWLKGVEAEISEWSVEIRESMAAPPIFEEAGPSRLEVPEDPDVSRGSGWTELRARSAVERYLRTRPWAPASDIAKALGMNLGLATRVAESVREQPGFD
ncbi:MAG TPA: hypothetical protein VI915_06680 [Thermoplasmata archaeon]|nr:hypothetical protein [Thermoplasmata archaeon]